MCRKKKKKRTLAPCCLFSEMYEQLCREAGGVKIRVRATSAPEEVPLDFTRPTSGPAQNTGLCLRKPEKQDRLDRKLDILFILRHNMEPFVSVQRQQPDLCVCVKHTKGRSTKLSGRLTCSRQATGATLSRSRRSPSATGAIPLKLDPPFVLSLSLSLSCRRVRSKTHRRC